MPSPPPRRPPRPRMMLRIGVAGHRPGGDRLDPTPAVETAMRAVFDACEDALVTRSLLRRPLYDHDHKAEIVLISALAPGADQQATTAFFDRPGRDDLVRRLEVILPFPEQAYAATFADAETRTFLTEAIEKADTVLTLADWAPPPVEDSWSKHRAEARYLTTGDILVRQADVLLAVWDGAGAQGRGGTTDVISLSMNDGTPIVHLDSPTGRISLIHPAELSNGDKERHTAGSDIFAAVQRRRQDFSPGALEKVVQAILDPRLKEGMIDDVGAFLNRENVEPSSLWSVYHNFLGAGFAGKSPALRLQNDFVTRQRPIAPDDLGADRVRSHLEPAWADADAVATGLGHRYRSTYVLIMLLGGAAVATGLVGTIEGLWMGEPFYIISEICFLGVALLLTGEAARARRHRRWLQAREIAERLRARWPLALLGLVGRRPAPPSTSGSAWLVDAYTSSVGLPDVALGPGELSRIAELIRLQVVEDQAGYHARNAEQLHHINEGLERWSRRVLYLAAASSLSLLILLTVDWALMPDWIEDVFERAHRSLKITPELLRGCLIVVSAALPAFGAAFAGIRFQGDFARFSERSTQTRAALQEIDHRLAALRDETTGAATHPHPVYEELVSLVLELERVLLTDLSDWRFVYAARPEPEP